MLTLVVFLPLVGIPVLAVWRRMSDETAKWIALLVTLGTFLVSLGVLGRFDASRSGFQLVESANWVASLGIRYEVGVDGVSLFMLLLTSFLMPLSILASWKNEKSVRLFMASMLLLETGMLGTFVSLDLVLFFLFFEAILLPMYLIIGTWGGERRVYAAIKFFLYTMAGSALLLVAILFLYFKANGFLGHPTADFAQLQTVARELPAATQRLLFAAFFVAFAVKVPVFPLHTWLPDAHTEAPTAGSVILAGVMLKVGAYGLIRFNLGLFPAASMYFSTAVEILAVIGILYGAVVALIQTDLKRLVAYSSVSHLGFVVLGIFAFTGVSITGSVLQMINHGLSTGALFLLVGMVYERTHTRDLSRMGGLAQQMPWLTGAFLFAVFASAGLPGLNNFIGEFLVILGTFAVHRVFGVLAAGGVILAAIYLLWSYQRMANGPISDENRHLPDLSLREVAILVPILSALLLFGVYPKLLTDRIEPAAGAAVSRVTAPHYALLGSTTQANPTQPRVLPSGPSGGTS